MNNKILFLFLIGLLLCGCAPREKNGQAQADQADKEKTAASTKEIEVVVYAPGEAEAVFEEAVMTDMDTSWGFSVYDPQKNTREYFTSNGSLVAEEKL